MSFPPSPRLACPPPVSVPPWAYLYVLPVCSLSPLHDSSFPVHFPVPPRARHLPCCPSVSSPLSAARPLVFSPLHTHSRHTVQQQTNHAIAASTSALKQMAELLRGCSRVCSLGAGGGQGPGRGWGDRCWPRGCSGQRSRVPLFTGPRAGQRCRCRGLPASWVRVPCPPALLYVALTHLPPLRVPFLPLHSPLASSAWSRPLHPRPRPLHSPHVPAAPPHWPLMCPPALAGCLLSTPYLLPQRLGEPRACSVVKPSRLTEQGPVFFSEAGLLPIRLHVAQGCQQLQQQRPTSKS